MIFEGSRYEDVPIQRIEDAEGVYRPTIIMRLPYPYQFYYSTYVVVEGDRLDILASRFLGDPEQWWRLALANPELDYPDELTAGQTLRIPNASRLL